MTGVPKGASTMLAEGRGIPGDRLDQRRSGMTQFLFSRAYNVRVSACKAGVRVCTLQFMRGLNA